MNAVLTAITGVEERFLDVSGLSGQLAKFPITAETHLQTATDKLKSNEFSEVFTPLWMVDDMLGRISDYDWKNQEKETLDLCAGYGQFTIRMLRKKYSLLNTKFKLVRFLTETHNFAEYQFSSVYKLLYIFGNKINVYIGDARFLGELPENANGIMIYSETHSKWSSISGKVKKMLNRTDHGTYQEEQCDNFVALLKKCINEINEGAV